MDVSIENIINDSMNDSTASDLSPNTSERMDVSAGNEFPPL